MDEDGGNDSFWVRWEAMRASGFGEGIGDEGKNGNNKVERTGGVPFHVGSCFVFIAPSQSMGLIKSWDFWVFRMKTQPGLRAK